MAESHVAACMVGTEEVVEKKDVEDAEEEEEAPQSEMPLSDSGSEHRMPFYGEAGEWDASASEDMDSALQEDRETYGPFGEADSAAAWCDAVPLASSSEVSEDDGSSESEVAHEGKRLFGSGRPGRRGRGRAAGSGGRAPGRGRRRAASPPIRVVVEDDMDVGAADHAEEVPASPKAEDRADTDLEDAHAATSANGSRNGPPEPSHASTKAPSRRPRRPKKPAMPGEEHLFVGLCKRLWRTSVAVMVMC